jgi:hypothetical protein
MIQETLENSNWLLPDNISDCNRTTNSKWYKIRERIVTDYYQTTSVTNRTTNSKWYKKRERIVTDYYQKSIVTVTELTVNDTRNFRE